MAMQQRDGAWSRRHAILIHKWHELVMRRPRAHWVRRVLEVQAGARLAARNVHHGGGAFVWHTGTRLPGQVPCRWEGGLAAARAAYEDLG